MTSPDAPNLNSLLRLRQIVAKLRDPKDGCPWDLQQDHESLLPYFFEELHEFAESLRTVGPGHPHTQEELGDVLYQVMIHCQLMEEKGSCDFDKLCEILSNKLLNRHPHVFDANFPRFKTAAEVNRAWEQIKAHAKAKAANTPADANPQSSSSAAAKQSKSSLQGVPSSLPALHRAARIGEKAASLGFDWSQASQVWEKVREESAEVEEAQSRKSAVDEQEEIGDLLFALAQYSRKKAWNPEELLAKANNKFLDRFAKMEARLTKSGKSLADFSVEQMEEAWTAIKIGS